MVEDWDQPGFFPVGYLYLRREAPEVQNMARERGSDGDQDIDKARLGGG
jgi:hypothetical protein